jgi:hypothetical protein
MVCAASCALWFLRRGCAHHCGRPLGRQPVAQVIRELAPFDAAVLVAETFRIGGAGDPIEKYENVVVESPFAI